jgi:hypothetical protein
MSIKTAHHPGACTVATLRRENRRFHGTGGVSQANRGFGFRPAFLDGDTGRVYLSRFSDGKPAPLHVLDGLPEELVLLRSSQGRITTVKDSVIAGFILETRFYTRQQAARLLGSC